MFLLDLLELLDFYSFLGVVLLDVDLTGLCLSLAVELNFFSFKCTLCIHHYIAIWLGDLLLFWEPFDIRSVLLGVKTIDPFFKNGFCHLAFFDSLMEADKLDFYILPETLVDLVVWSVFFAIFKSMRFNLSISVS